MDLKDLKYYQNYHKHTSLSHRYNKDSPLTYNNYFKYYNDNYSSKGLPQIYSTVEHGWQSTYFHIYDDLEKFNKNNLKDNPNYKPIKFIFGTEGYWVKDRFEKDSSNCHIVLLAKNENGRKKLNRAIYESFKTGYYYKNRMDLDILLSLPKSDIFVTSACLAFWNSYKIDNNDLPFVEEPKEIDYTKIDEIVLKLYNHFDDFYLEVQANQTDIQKEINRHILQLHYQYGIPIIAGTDSHVIDNSQLVDRDDLLKSNRISYPEEEGWYMDCPSIEEFIRRFQEQEILSDNEIYEAINNTNKILDFEDIVLDRSLKVPVAKKYKHLSLEERNDIFENILREEWKRQYNDINEDKFDQYIKEIKHDIKEVEACHMADYFIDNYEIMKLGQEKYGGILTPSGRGSGVSMYLNKLLGFTKVDKVNSPVLMYSERFLTKERVLGSKTPPDIDHNVADREPFIQAQKDIICEEGTFDLIALGTLKYKSAFKMYARAYDLDPQIANDVTKQITKYENALKYAEEDEKEYIDIFDYVDKEKYGNLIEGCQEYMGIVDNLKSHPCGCLCYDGDAIEDVGVIMVRSESTGRECFVALLESGTIDAFGYLKQDYLIVDSIGLTYDIYKEIGMKPLTVNELLDKINNDEKVWNIYKNGYTMCINQCEQERSTKKVGRYKPKNISELTQFVAGIRPSFKTMYKIFESRQHFDYGIKAFDSLIQDEYCDSSFILYQEHLMKVLGFAGFPMSETYTIIKAISKKKQYVIKGAKEKFIPNFAQAILHTGETNDLKIAEEMSHKVWQIIEDSAAYGFNCVSGETKLKRPSTNGKYNPSVEEMYKIMHDRNYAIKTGHKSLSEKYRREGYGYGLSMKNGRLFKNKIIDIYKQPKATTYTITTESGKKIKATENHKFPTKNGIKLLKDLKINDFLYCMDKYEKTKFDSSLTNGDFENNYPKIGQCGFQKKENGDSVVYDNFRLKCINNNVPCEICNLPYSHNERFEVHHKDFNRKNNIEENYSWLCASCHKKEHYKNGRTKQYENGIPTYFEKIISIEQNEIEYVYDIEMSEDVAHNFVTEDGIVTCNSAHAYCMAIDSVTLAWQKAYYPLEFYKVTLQRYTNKGNKDKVSLLKKEMLRMGIKLNPIKFGDDNRQFSIDKEHNSINQTMASIKDMQKIVPDLLYEIGLNYQDNGIFFIFRDMLKSKINKKSFDILIKLNYFRDFGDTNYVLNQLEIYKEMLSIIDKLIECKQLKKDYCEEIGLPIDKVKLCCKTETPKMFKDIDNEKLAQLFKDNYIEIENKISEKYNYQPTTNLEIIKYQVQLLGYSDIIDNSISQEIYLVEQIETNNYGTPFLSLYHPYDGESLQSIKVDKKWFNEYPCEVGDFLRCSFKDKPKKKKDENGKWYDTGEIEHVLNIYSVI